MRKLFQKTFGRLNGRRQQRGQVLVIVVFAMVGLISAIGLVVDVGITFIQFGRLRRAVDAAALSASLQYREGVGIDQLTLSATEFLVLNDINDPTATVTTCVEDPNLCDKNGNGLTDPGENRKFVHVVANTNAELAFMPILGIRTVPLTAEAVSEAASLDVILVIDISESMTNDAPNYPDPGNEMRDPSVCNNASSGGPYSGDCSPFLDVKKAASSFVDYLFLPYDRVAVVTFDDHPHLELPLDHCEVNGLDQAYCYSHVQNTIRNLEVTQRGGGIGPGTDGACDFSEPASGPCRKYAVEDGGDGHYVGFDCPAYHLTRNPASCGTTNIGGGLLEAGNEFGFNGREEALWVVILLTDGAANSSTDVTMTNPHGFCPASTHTQPFCRDALVSTRHCADADTRTRCETEGGVWDPENFDADDFARDMADFTGKDQSALVFTIGLGDLVTSYPAGDPDAGEQLLMYTADAGGGLYYFAPSGDELRDIFKQIADNIAVRLTR